MVKRLPLLIAAAVALAPAAVPSGARPPSREQDAALKGLQQGRILPLRTIEQRIVPRMRGFDYLGPELDAGAARYRLKFMRGAQVVWIDVDGRTGQIIGHSGDR
jgi:uncharacterized membrane protein YkoI